MAGVEGTQVGVCYYEDRDTHQINVKALNTSHFQIVEESSQGVSTLRMHGWSTSPTTALGLELWVKLNEALVKEYIIRHGRPDILHAHNTLYAGYLAMRLSHRLGIPYVLTEHSSQFIQGIDGERQQHIIRKVLRRASAVWAVSGALGRAMELYCTPGSVSLMPNFIDTAFFDRPRDEHKKGTLHLFSLANLNANKGFDTLLAAFARAFAGQVSVTLTIGGSGPLSAFLKATALRLGIGSQVCFIGELDRDAVAVAMSHSDLFVLASRVETFGVVFVEAMASGLPVVATDCGGPAEFITPECGVVVPAGDPVLLAEALIRMRAEFGRFDSQVIRQYARDNFDSALLAHRLIAQYNQILGR